MSLDRVLLSVLVMAGVTFFTRAVPFLFFGKRRPPEAILYAGRYIPPIVMTLLVLYALKDIPVSAAPHGLPEIVAVALVALLHLWKRNALVSIFGGTLAYMVFVQSGVFFHLFGG